MQALQELGTDMVNPKNFASIVKLSTDLERQSLTAETVELEEEAKADEGVEIVIDV